MFKIELPFSIPVKNNRHSKRPERFCLDPSQRSKRARKRQDEKSEIIMLKKRKLPKFVEIIQLFANFYHKCPSEEYFTVFESLKLTTEANTSILIVVFDHSIAPLRLKYVHPFFTSLIFHNCFLPCFDC